MPHIQKQYIFPKSVNLKSWKAIMDETMTIPRYGISSSLLSQIWILLPRNMDSGCLHSMFQQWGSAEGFNDHRLKESYTSRYFPNTLVETTGRPVNVNEETVYVGCRCYLMTIFELWFGKAPVLLRIYSRDLLVLKMLDQTQRNSLTLLWIC